MSVFAVGFLLPLMVVGGLLLALFVLALSGKGRSEAAHTLGRLILFVALGALGLFVIVVGGHLFASSPGSGPVRAQGVGLFGVLLLALMGVLVTVLLVNRTTRKAAGYVLLVLVLVAIAGFFVSIPIQTRRVVEVQPASTVPRPAIAPIWSEGIEAEFDADIYPSKESAMRALGRRMGETIGRLAAEPNEIRRVAVFQQDNEHALAGVFASALTRALPEVHTAVETGRRNLFRNEAGVEFRQIISGTPVAAWSRISGRETVGQGRIEVTTFIGSSGTTINESFIEKPWVENFSIFANSHPSHEFATARSNEACTSESEARQQAMAEATRLVGGAIWDRIDQPRVGSLTITPSDLHDKGIVLDTFTQSFHGTAAPVWREAVLLDLSPERLMTLAQAKTVQVQAVRKTWVVLIGQAVGVFVVIFLAYLFLNMATRGYYDWALRIAGLVLAVAVIAILFFHASPPALGTLF